MADTIHWFIFRRESHAVDTTKPKLATVCGLVPMPNFSPEVHHLSEGEWPPDVCQRCLVRVGSEQTNDEPLEAAKARGYVASRDVRGLAPLPADVI